MFRARAVLLGVFLAVLLAVPILEQAIRWGDSAGIGHDVADFRKALADPLYYLLQRSPGARAAFGLLQTKHGAPGSLAKKHDAGRPRANPHERVLANVRYGPPGWSPSAFADELVGHENPLLMPVDFTKPNSGGAAVGGLPPSGVPGYIGIVPRAPTAPPIVPEPATWVALIWGLFLVGTALRSCKHPRGALNSVTYPKVSKQQASSRQPFAQTAGACPELSWKEDPMRRRWQ